MKAYRLNVMFKKMVTLGQITFVFLTLASKGLAQNSDQQQDKFLLKDRCQVSGDAFTDGSVNLKIDGVVVAVGENVIPALAIANRKGLCNKTIDCDVSVRVYPGKYLITSDILVIYRELFHNYWIRLEGAAVLYQDTCYKTVTQSSITTGGIDFKGKCDGEDPKKTTDRIYQSLINNRVCKSLNYTQTTAQ